MSNIWVCSTTAVMKPPCVHEMNVQVQQSGEWFAIAFCPQTFMNSTTWTFEKLYEIFTVLSMEFSSIMLMSAYNFCDGFINFLFNFTSRLLEWFLINNGSKTYLPIESKHGIYLNGSWWMCYNLILRLYKICLCLYNSS